jgi:hypothetical protein
MMELIYPCNWIILYVEEVTSHIFRFPPFIVKATEFSTVVAKPTMGSGRFVKCWIKFGIAAKAFHIQKSTVTKYSYNYLFAWSEVN